LELIGSESKEALLAASAKDAPASTSAHSGFSPVKIIFIVCRRKSRCMFQPLG
jgi:hypothetical protein